MRYSVFISILAVFVVRQLPAQRTPSPAVPLNVSSEQYQARALGFLLHRTSGRSYCSTQIRGASGRFSTGFPIQCSQDGSHSTTALWCRQHPRIPAGSPFAKHKTSSTFCFSIRTTGAFGKYSGPRSNSVAGSFVFYRPPCLRLPRSLTIVEPDERAMECSLRSLLFDSFAG